MIELKIEDKVYEMPSSWKEVNIKKYIEIQNIEDGTEMKKMVQMISILSDCPIDLLYTINIEDLGQIDMRWVGQFIPKDFDKFIIINNIEYGMIKDINKLNLGEYVDLDYYSQDVNNNLHKIVAILMRKVVMKDGDLYLIEDYKGGELETRAEIFLEHMNVSQLMGVAGFFLNIGNGFLENMKSYSASQEKTTKK